MTFAVVTVPVWVSESKHNTLPQAHQQHCCCPCPFLQANVLGALSVMLIDRQCRVPFVKLEPACTTLFTMCKNMEGYSDAKSTAARREAAAKAINSLMQRDHDARTQLIETGNMKAVLQLLDPEVKCMSTRS